MRFFAYLRGMFEHYTKHKSSYLSMLAALSLSGLFGCASTGTPGGGLYDETPPVLRNSNPAIGATGVKAKKITLHFDENVKLDNATEKMTVSPPQSKMPTIQSNAKTVTIELQDDLLPDATYSIDLGDAVQDNNEGNPMESLSLLFSTGDHIDSLRISGYVLNAADLEPVTGAYVGIYSDTLQMSDSLLMTVPMQRAGRTDALGKFTILGIAPGSYRVYALIDGNSNYMYDLNTEDIAFIDSLIVPSTTGRIVHDTIWQDLDSTIIDTIKMRDELVYLPDNLILKSFNEGKVTRYLDDISRQDSLHINVRFAAKMPELPTISVVDSLEAPIDLVVEPNPTLDTLIYWIKDSLHIKMDTLNLQMSYLYTDTTGIDIIRTDTVRLTKPVVKPVKDNDKGKDEKGKGKKNDKKKRSRPNKEEAPADSLAADSVPKVIITYMDFKLLSKSPIDIGSKPVFEASAPLDSLDVSKIHLEQKVDTVWKPMQFHLVHDTANIRQYIMYADPHFSPGQSYRVTVDSAAMHNIYGHPVKKAEITFDEKKPEDYSHLLFNITGAEGPAYVELLSEKDVPVYKVKVKDGKAKFVNVNEGKYFVRLVEDRNDNGKFDVGNLEKKIQPENVYYFGAELQLRANWDTEQNWNIKQTELYKQKPDSVKINKPKEKTEKKSKNAEYLAKLGKTPKQTNTGTTTSTGTTSRMQQVNRNR